MSLVPKAVNKSNNDRVKESGLLPFNFLLNNNTSVTITDCDMVSFSGKIEGQKMFWLFTGNVCNDDKFLNIKMTDDAKRQINKIKEVIFKQTFIEINTPRKK